MIPRRVLALAGLTAAGAVAALAVGPHLVAAVLLGGTAVGLALAGRETS